METRRRSLNPKAFVTAIAAIIAFSVQAQTPPSEPVAQETTDVPVEETTIPAPEIKPLTAREICIDDNDSRSVLDRIHSRLYKLTCSSASWFDGLFGNSRFDEEYRATHGSVTVGSLWSQRKALEEVLRFRAHLVLPQMNRRLHAFVGRVDRDDYVSESEHDVYGLPQEFNRNTTETTLVGVGYNEPLKKRGSFDVGTGVRLTFPLDPYIKGSYRFARPVGERNLIRLRETIFWQNSEELGVTSRIDWDHIVGEEHLLRYSASGTFSQVSEGMRWFTNITLFHFISSNRAMAYDIAANGSTDREIPLTDYGGSVIYRQRVFRDWLLLELRGGVDWPRDWPFERRHYNLNAGLAFELRFGKDTQTF